MTPAYAHSLKDHPPEQWELLSSHLAEVAELAASYASAFNAKAWGEVLGNWHDLGKLSGAFQRYIRGGDPDAGEETGTGRVDHSTYGARHAAQTVPGIAGQLLAFAIAGHHCGLTDASPLDDRSALSFRLDPAKRMIPPITLPPEVAVPPALALPWRETRKWATDVGFSLAFFGRMLFSCLIDADRTATERFCNPTQAAERNHLRPTLDQLWSALDAFLSRKQKDAPSTPVNAIRARVLADCLAAANDSPGFFSLNVPTGGGKTFASLAFALHHATANPALRRVVVAIPFTSIIEQTADQYRQALGTLAETGLIEHHSNLNPGRDTRQNKLASENWAAPLVVTTNVQLFESLFAAKTTPARKLHRLANSVIILDEAQTLPVDLLAPTLSALKELVMHYGCSVMLCTATQPALEWREKEFEIGISNVRPIIANPNELHSALRRVTIERVGALSNAVLAERLSNERQALCIVNTKAHAAKLYEALIKALGSAAGCFHLSTFMCPQHRRDVLADIRRRLKGKQPCRVVSTQLIEAGVDVDFPCVYRAEAGFDSIAQAAGRCNREGQLRDVAGLPVLGRVYVYEADTPPPPGLLRSAAETAGEIADQFPDPLLPDAVRAYFGLFYWSQKRDKNWDAHDVLRCFEFNAYEPSHRKLAPFMFRAAADRYRIIRDEQTPVVVPYNDEANRLIARLQTGEPLDYASYKAAQQYGVGVRESLLRQLQQNAALVRHESGLWFLPNPNGYSRETGLLANAMGLDAEAFVL
ncbi:MAG: CRISPR-associated endonuclease Cas3'' [Tepidisphaeraceae bacterium]